MESVIVLPSSSRIESERLLAEEPTQEKGGG
jgi:hypothetical protein